MNDEDIPKLFYKVVMGLLNVVYFYEIYHKVDTILFLGYLCTA